MSKWVTKLTPISDIDIGLLSAWKSQKFKATTSDQRDHALADSYNYRLSVDLTTEDDRCHYDGPRAPKTKIVADPIGIGVRVGGPYLPLDYVGAACLAEISASAG